MIIYEYKSGSTLIRFDDRDITTNEKNKEILNISLSLIIKKFSNNLVK